MIIPLLRMIRNSTTGPFIGTKVGRSKNEKNKPIHQIKASLWLLFDRNEPSSFGINHSILQDIYE